MRSPCRHGMGLEVLLLTNQVRGVRASGTWTTSTPVAALGGKGSIARRYTAGFRRANNLDWKPRPPVSVTSTPMSFTAPLVARSSFTRTPADRSPLQRRRSPRRPRHPHALSSPVVDLHIDVGHSLLDHRQIQGTVRPCATWMLEPMIFSRVHRPTAAATTLSLPHYDPGR